MNEAETTRTKVWLLAGLLAFVMPALLGIIVWVISQTLFKVDQMFVLQSNRGERITKLEAERLADKEALARIERKLDDLTQLILAKSK